MQNEKELVLSVKMGYHESIQYCYEYTTTHRDTQRVFEEKRMEQMTVGKAAALCGGSADTRWENISIPGWICIDSRAVRPGDLFAAYRGEHTDGHRFIGAAFEKGAVCCVAEEIPEGVNQPVILVENVQRALEKLAAAYRREFDIPVVGITGSVGKTTAKEMIGAVLSQRYCTLRTEGNLNNLIGVPMMLSRLEKGHQAAVIEMGISEFGEMRELSEVVQPTMAVYTVIGHAHLEFLHNLEGVLQAKTEMLEYLPETAPVFVNGDDSMLRGVQMRQRKILYGLNEDCDVRAEELCVTERGTDCTIRCGLRAYPVHVPESGQQYVTAALGAAAVGMALGLTDEEIARGIADFHNVGRRGDIIRTGYLTLMDDSYNANPDSVCCAIDSLLQLRGKRHICVLGDMLELGNESPRLHREVGEYAFTHGIDLVLSAGAFASDTAEGAGEKGIAYNTREELAAELRGFLQKDDCVLVKASKGSHFEKISEAIQSIREDDRPQILLDLDNTILDFDEAEARALSKSLKELGEEPRQEILRRYHTVNLGYWERLENGEMTREEILVGRFCQLKDEFDLHVDPAALRDRYEYNLSHGHYYIEGAEGLLNTLQKKYRLFLVSNGTAVVQKGRLDSAGIRPIFEKIFISEDLGVNKPEKQFFMKCFAEIPNFDRSRCIMVGDSLTSDIRGGQNAGIMTCWFHRQDKAPREDIVPDYEISSLAELPELLERVFSEKQC